MFFRKNEAYRARGKGREGRNTEIKGEVLLDGFFLKSISIPSELHFFFSLLASSKYIFLPFPCDAPKPGGLLTTSKPSEYS